MIVLKGNVEKTLYYKEESNWGIFLFKTEDDGTKKIKGSIPRIFDSKKLELECEEEIDIRYGKQYKILNAKICPVTTDYEIKKYLSSGEFKGIGEATAEKIVSKFGQKTIDIIKNNPEILSTIKGISKEKALKMQLTAKSLEVYEDSLKYLLSLGISHLQTTKIINFYKMDAIAVISQNPYKLIEDLDGIGFLRADEIASKIGIPKTAITRLEKLFLYLLEEICQRVGSTTVKIEQIRQEFIKKSEINDKEKEKILFEKVLNNLKNTKEIVCKESKENIYISQVKFYNMEKYIAEKLFSINNSLSLKINDIDKLIEMFELKNKIQMTLSQKNAIKNSINSQVSIITGGPGTGKTTITKCIIEILKKQNQRVLQVAPTGRAAKRMEESTCYEAKTIHRLLGVDFDGSFIHNQNNKIICNALIVDEFSMCDTAIVYNLLKALDDDVKLIFIGDKDQLQSVSPGNVLEDLIVSNKFTTSYLDFIFRQKEGSSIKEVARKVNLRQKVDLDKYRSLDNEVVYIDIDNEEDLKNKISILIKEEIPKKFNCSCYDVQILSPNKAGSSGSLEINKTVQETINKENNQKSIIIKDIKYRVGDKVIHTKNDYSLPWKQKIALFEEKGQAIFNGEIGIIKDIINDIVYVEYDDFKIAEYRTKEQKSNIDLAYAISIHKSQGSEFDFVIIANIVDNYITNTSKVLYTGITRAKKAIYLLTNQKTFNSALKAKKAIPRLTQLRWFLQS